MRHGLTSYAFYFYCLFLLLIWRLAQKNGACCRVVQTFSEGTAVYGGSVQQTADGGYIICGTAQSYGGRWGTMSYF